MGSIRSKPHAVCIPSPASSHIGAMLKLAKLLHHKGFHISFVNTEFNRRRLTRARGHEFASGTPSDFQFLTIPDGLPPSDADAIQDIPMLCDSARNRMVGPFSDLISSLGSNPSVPPVTCIVSDGFMTFTTSPAASKFGIPLIHLFTIPGCALMALKHLRALGENGLALLTDESQFMNGYGNTPIDWIPGMKNMRLRDMPSFFRMTSSDNTLFNFTADATDRTSDATATIIHTFEALEPDVLHALSSIIPRVCAVGPLHLMVDRITREKSFALKHIECNLLEEHEECLQWLDSRDPESVIYVNFGSIAFMTHQQLVEFAMGLANSDQYFLWVLRPDAVDGDVAVLPEEFVKETKERGFLLGVSKKPEPARPGPKIKCIFGPDLGTVPHKSRYCSQARPKELGLHPHVHPHRIRSSSSRLSELGLRRRLFAASFPSSSRSHSRAQRIISLFPRRPQI